MNLRLLLTAHVTDANPAQANRMPRLINRVFTILSRSRSPQSTAVMLLLVAAICLGCNEKPMIRQYTIPGKMPAVLVTSDRMLGAILPQDSVVWFVKVVGPAESVKLAEAQIRTFATELKFNADGPILSKLPAGWNRGPEKQMRFATLLVDTPESQLDISISQLPLSGDWDEQVAMNVNRWRGQMKLPASTEKWAGAEPIQVAAAVDKQAVWVDLTGDMGAGPSMPSMTSSSPPFTQMAAASPVVSPESAASQVAPAPDSELKYEKPEQWRAGKMSMMRLAAFSIGPEDEPAELTIIQAGGDLRGNVARWLGQVRGDSPPDKVVDDALALGEPIKVSGRDAQRYYLSGGETANEAPAQAIDATIVPMENGMNMFVKATGPLKTIQAEKDRIGDFIRSLQLP